MNPLLHKRFVVVAGKGGVGRTSVTFVLGKWAAASGKKVLMCLAHSGSRYRHILGGKNPQGINELSPNLFLLNIDPVAAREEYALKIIKNRFLHKLVFSNKYVNSFLDAVPGLSEWAMLGKATYHALDDAEEHERYDMVIFDSPPTGHGLDILKLPLAIAQSVQGGRMRQDALLRVALLKDTTACAIVPICLPEELPVNETIELSLELQKQGMPLHAIIVNKVVDTLPQEAHQYCESLCRESMMNANWARPSLIRQDQRREQIKHIDRLRQAIDVPLLHLPKLDSPNLTDTELEQLSHLLSEQITRRCL